MWRSRDLAVVLALVVGLATGASACSDDESSAPAPTTTSTGTGGSGGTAGSGGATSSGGSTGTGGSAGGASSGRWSMGYYASWKANTYPIAEIEWSGLTHIAMAFYMPGSDGSLALMSGDTAFADDLVAAAEAHGVEPIASIGGADSAVAFRQATSSGTMDAFVANLISLLDDVGYGGIDIDWEPMETTDEPAVIEIAERIRAARPEATLTIPVGYVNVNLPQDLSGYAAIAAAYDQMNLMSYGMAGSWSGWNSWHSSPLYHDSGATPTSIDSTVQLYDAAGVPLAKLGVGIGFYGLCYSPPVDGPDQPLNGSTLLASDSVMSYANIMGSYYDDNARQWDTLARVPYLSFASAQPPDGCGYISYEDAQSIEEKAAYLTAQGLGGVIMWEINEGYIASAPAGERSPLLLAIRDHVLN